MIGRVLGTRYRLDAELGRGGMGVVYRAHDSLLGRDVAVKLLSGADLSAERRAHLLREAQAAAQLNHPNIVAIHDAGEADPEPDSANLSAQAVPFVVMELVEGESLHRRRPQELSEIVAITRQVCAALEHAHAHGIVHRDLKPENVLITAVPLAGTGSQGSAGGTAKLVDFGLARSLTARMTSQGSIVGTVLYLAPEMVQGQDADHRVDLYALGVMLYELTTGTLPFEADDPVAVIAQHLHAPVIPPRAKNPEIPAALEALIVRLLNKEPDERPASAAEVRLALEQLTEGDPSPRPSPSPLERLARGRLVGREREFAEARALWRQATSGSGERRVLLISGEAGIGKTPLVDNIRTLAEVSGGRAFRGICYSQGNAPYGPMAQIIRESLPHLPAEPGGLVLGGLITIAPDLQARYPEVEPSPPLDPRAEQQRLFESVVAMCSALAERAPLLLILEDVHWADGGTLFLVRHLARRSRSARLPLLIVMTYRESEVGDACCLDDVLLDLDHLRLAARVKLARLSREQTGELLAVLLQDEVSDEFLEGIYRETEGNPFFVEEMCKALIDDGSLQCRDGRWHRPRMDQIRLPQSVKMVIQSRVGRLPAEVQSTLRLAAVIGREFEFETLLEAGDLGEGALVDALEAAERAQLVSEVKPGSSGNGAREAYRFAHKLTVTALRESVSGVRRRRMHRRVADSIRALYPDDGARLEQLAYHYREAGDQEGALTYTLQAADRARQVYANEEAIALYGEALDLMSQDQAGRFEVLAARSRVYDIVARRDEQREDVMAMLALAEEMDDDARRFDALMAQADLYLETESFRAREPAERAVVIARGLNDPVCEGHALRRLGQEARYRYDHVGSRDALESATSRFREAGLPGEAAVCLHLQSLTMGELKEHDAALEAAEEALALSRAAGDRRQEAISLRRLAIVYLNRSEYEQARPFAEKALAIHRQLGDRSEECRALNVLGVIAGWLGRSEEAGRYLHESLELADATGSSMSIRSAVVNLLWSHFRWLGEFEAALMLLDEQLSKADLANDEVLAVHLALQRPLFLGILGEYGKALEAVEVLLPELERLMSPAIQALYLSFMGCMHAELGELDRAHAAIEVALERAKEIDAPVETAATLLNQAYVALLSGGRDSLGVGLTQAERASELLRAAALTENLAAALHRVAQLHLALGQLEPAKGEAETDRRHVAAAVACSDEVMELVRPWPSQPETYLYTHACALRATGHESEADAYLERAYERVMLVAAKTRDESLRRSWLEKVRVNREIVSAQTGRGSAP